MQNVNFNNPSIEVNPVTITRKYTVSILKLYSGSIIVRKSEIYRGVSIPLREESARSIIHAEQIQDDLINELYGFRLD